MKQSPGVIWDGNHDNELHEKITIFASIVDLSDKVELVSLYILAYKNFQSVFSTEIRYIYIYKPGPYIRSLFFDKNTVDQLCDAVIKAEDAVVCVNDEEEIIYHPISILRETKMFQLSG